VTPKVINRTIAEACGWMRCVCNDPECDAWFPPNSHEPKLGVLNYCFDLNAIHVAEAIFTRDSTPSAYEYAHHLYNVVVPKEVQPFRATAAQRAEAFLRTVGKWETTP
jgi:hypothetical protein